MKKLFGALVKLFSLLAVLGALLLCGGALLGQDHGRGGQAERHAAWLSTAAVDDSEAEDYADWEM